MIIIKNWKIITSSTEYIMWKHKDGYSIAVDKTKFKSDGSHLWNVRILANTNDYKSFYTKNKALKFAKNWMRRHPNG